MFKDPFILASGPPTRNGEMISKAFEIGWNAAVTKTICLNHSEMSDVPARIHKLENGIKNIELISPVSAEQWAEEIRLLKDKYPNKTIIASISAEAGNIEAWHKLTRMMQEAGSDILELNFSCPHGLPEIGMGNTCSDSPEIAASIIKYVKQVATIPVWAKLSPNVTSISELALACAKTGADGITAINTVKGFAGIDIITGKPKQSVDGMSTYGGLSGQIIKPIALKAVSEIASSVSCPISGVGGVASWQDAAEFILLGASTVQICTEVMLKGYQIINDLHCGLKNYLNNKQLEDIKGTSLKYITTFSQLDKTCSQTYQVLTENCTKCGKCTISCADAGYQAISTDDSGLPYINAKKCSGCGLCVAVCPVDCVKSNEITTLTR